MGLNWIGAYTSPAEAERKHPDLRADNVTPFAEIDTLIPTGRYRYPESAWVKCRLERDGRTCPRDHGKGFIIRRTNGTEGYVGWCCYQKHLKFSDEFVMRVAALDVHYKEEELARQIAEKRSDTAFRANVEELRAAHSDVEVWLFKVRTHVPKKVLHRLGVIRRQASHAVAIETKTYRRDGAGGYVKNEHGSPIIDTRRERMGVLAGLQALDESRREKLSKDVNRIIESLDEAIANEHPTQELFRRWTKAFDTAPATRAEVERFQQMLRNFMRRENLELLYFLGEQVGELEATIEGVGQLVGHSGYGEQLGHVAATFREVITTRLKCDSFRVL